MGYAHCFDPILGGSMMKSVVFTVLLEGLVAAEPCLFALLDSHGPKLVQARHFGVRVQASALI